ncbi:MAG: hypothetical protein E7474_13250 [Ruminococcaceae bacterium]|nr:hypothetical protein [Oscillospiraceae bacterium]
MATRKKNGEGDERKRVSSKARSPTGAAEETGEVTRDDVARRLLELYRRCLQAERVMTYDKDEKAWMKSDEWKVDARGAAMALEQLSELMGFGAGTKGPDGVELRLSGEAAELGE